MIKKAIIISAGTIKDYKYIKSFINTDDLIICADGGYIHSKNMGVTPHIIVGDFDSLGYVPDSSDFTQIIKHPKDKDFTDTELAVHIAKEKGANYFLLFGVVGSRLDHSLSNITMLERLNNEKTTAIIINENNKIYFCKKNKKITLYEPLESLVSLIPMSPCSGVYTKGLKYQLKNADMLPGYGLGVSNVVKYVPATITLNDGNMLVIVACD